MQNIYKYCLVLLMGSLFLLSGCGSDMHISLEEALTVSDSSSETLTEEELTGQVPTQSVLVVYVCGQVASPGVYELAAGSRIVSAIEAAGGFLESAAAEAINLAEPVQDGMQIDVPDLEEAAQAQLSSVRHQAGLVNINQASLQELCTLQGIGEAKAQAIMDYREALGGFQSIEQLREVSGIGERLFEQIKDSIYIE